MAVLLLLTLLAIALRPAHSADTFPQLVGNAPPISLPGQAHDYMPMVRGNTTYKQAGTPNPYPWSMSATPSLEIGPGQFVPAITLTNATSAPQAPNYFTYYSHLILNNAFKNVWPWLTCDPSVSPTMCIGQGPILRAGGDLCCGDFESGGALDARNIEGQQIGARVTGAQPGGPELIVSSEEASQVDDFGGAHIELYNDSASSGGPGPFRLGVIDSLAAAGTGYAVGDLIVLNTGATCSVKPTLRVYGSVGAGGKVLLSGVTVNRGLGGVCSGQPTLPLVQF